MHALLVLMVLQCIAMAWFQSCIYTETDYVCKEIPKDYPAGLTSVILFVSALGEIDSSMFNSTNLTSVTSLTMTRTGLTAVSPQTFLKFHNLQTLILDNNYLSHVSSDWFSHPEALETLRLSNNKITTLDHNSLFGMMNLLILNVSWNLIHTITRSSFVDMSKLRQLDLSNNNLTYLSVDVLRPLNGTKIHLDGNPWNCSCSVLDFARFLRGLQNASLLENEMQVCCSSPPELKGKPVWQVQECKVITTLSTTDRPVITNPATGHPVNVTPASTTKPLTTILISLIVLYHRKRVRKHLQTVKPSPVIVKTGETNNRGIQSEILEVPTENSTRKMLQKTHRMLVGDEMISQIYHIYSSGIYHSREPIKRVSSAGPVLCRTELFSQQTEIETSLEEVDTGKTDEYYDGCVTSEHQKENVRMNVEDVCEEVEQETDGRMRKEMDEEDTRINDEVNYCTDMPGSCDDGLRVNNNDEEVDNDAPHDPVKNNTETLTGAAGSSLAIPQKERSTDQIVENVENLPYLTIGADPENQNSVIEQSTATDERSGSLRPIRRVLTWPPTAVQWKKQWLQNQHVLNVFPKIIFVTGYGQFGHNACPASLPAAPRFNTLEFSPENVLTGEDVRVNDGDAYVQSLSGKVSPRMDGRIILKEETWRSDLFSQNSPVDETKVCAELFTILNQSSNDRDSKLASEKINNTDDVKKPQSIKMKRWQDQKSGKEASELKKRSRREENTTANKQQDQTCENSRAPDAGGSPNDDSLLLGNEYTYIDLLHEVVENHGRWTRERWRQTQKNKRKLKQGQSR